MKIYPISNLILATVICVSIQNFPAWAESSQWSGSDGLSTASQNLHWTKPKVTGRSTNNTVTVNQAEINRSASGIQQVQYLQPAKPLTPAQQDLMYPEKRPQPKTPQSGAVSRPLAPGTTLSPPQTEPVVQPALTPAPLPNNNNSLLDPGRAERAIVCPDNAGFKSIRDIAIDIRAMPAELPQECPLMTSPYSGRHFSQACYQWKASAVCTKMAYFEDPQLERYGHSVCPLLQPVISGAQFFLTIPLLPYKMGITPPNECVYTLGYYRPGNCAPYMLDPFPISIRAVLFEGAAIGGAVAAIP
jgi:hypothetical protein